MIHIIHFRPNPGGIELLMPAILRTLPGLQFRIFVIRPAGMRKQNVYEGHDDLSISYGADSNLIAFIRLFFYALKHRRDIFHLHNAGPFILILLRFACVKKIVYSIRGTKYWKKPWQTGIKKTAWRWGLGKNVKIVANSDFSRSVFLQEVSGKYPIEVLYNPVYNKNHYPPLEKNETKEIEIIYAGRLAKGKNLHRWLDIAATIQQKLKNTRFKIYGDGPLKNELLDYAENLKMEYPVKFMGFTIDITSAYRQADLLIFLSEYESFGNVVVESILCGTPVIASAIPSMKEIFANYPEFLVELDENLEENVLKKVKKLHQLKAKVPLAMEEFKESFSMQQHIQKLETIYNSFNHKS